MEIKDYGMCIYLYFDNVLNWLDRESFFFNNSCMNIVWIYIKFMLIVYVYKKFINLVYIYVVVYIYMNWSIVIRGLSWGFFY